jgi:RNA polymerase sigma-70 factor (ECF subfamily)
MKKLAFHIKKRNQQTGEKFFGHFAVSGEACFSSVFYELYPMLVYYSRKITYNEMVSEYLVDDIFVKAWERKQDFENYLSLKSFLYKSVGNASLDWLKKDRRLQSHKNGYESFRSDEARQEKQSLDLIIETEFLRELYSSFDKLPTQCRTVMKLFYVEGKTHQEIAAALKLSPSTIRNQKARGISLLRKMVELPVIILGLFGLAVI